MKTVILWIMLIDPSPKTGQEFTTLYYTSPSMTECQAKKVIADSKDYVQLSVCTEVVK